MFIVCLVLVAVTSCGGAGNETRNRKVYERLIELERENPQLDYGRLLALVGEGGDNIRYGFVPDFAKIFAIRDSSGVFSKVEMSISFVSPPLSSNEKNGAKLIVLNNEFSGSHFDELTTKDIHFGSLKFEGHLSEITNVDDVESGDVRVSLDGENYWGLGLYAEFKRLGALLNSEKGQVFEWHLPLNSAYPIQ